MSAGAIYSVVNLKKKRQDDAQGEDVVYTEIKFPDSLCPQNVSHDGKAGKDKPGSHPHPYRLTVVGLVMLCFLLIICIIVLSISLHRANRKSSVMEGDLQQLTSKNRNLTNEKEQIQEDSRQIEQNCSSLASDNIQLKGNYSITAKQKDVFQNNYEALIKKSQHLRLFCGTTDIQKPCRRCPQGWEPFNSNCYFISTDQKSWKDSRIECLKWGADLMIIDSKEEEDFIKKNTYDHWIGLTYNTEKNGWIWLDGTSLTGFQRPYYRNGFCAVIRSWSTSWEGWTCSTEARWICETKALLLHHL
ncbi:C-type lectin domain family 12 member B-like isoform X6 [Brienomyrus brachyistius]|uniref:C-type lectin domain family 12 member B-like isoform X5 n=1 Tax=Brienomyrus brachyistius TaxID=42636 RepID=UPI0020B39AD8|nr:C-type lectin domain family 12 member B-like isoform X5 [Brienomyrus brachyistius]XP_048836699.1 C-type lectin domain family 12 member B-like isoform X5 [Brienomyrus brachyistius]XP_048836700.1 C-type lectin domain family 12 member B-like isoform X5 [Brienomyrus brachyistius]XP_048836701.1 C-type lectin domain family 12 member B-like isoform X6 [Brienomyrus brachyistius]